MIPDDIREIVSQSLMCAIQEHWITDSEFEAAWQYLVVADND